ncbi:protein translocase subunit SecD [Candidatus Daviesbacteria bacterium]|nr:protein translocase subunit SecD [Candidatus Daviesbacteria bacterium]
MKSKILLSLILLITLAAILVNFLPFFPLKLGLDLQGGTQLILQAQMDKIEEQNRDSALESARQVIEKRVNLFGVTEAVVQSSKIGEERRILVELPGLKEPEAAANLVGKTAQLDFRELPATGEAKPTGLTGADLKKAQVSFGGGGNVKSGPEVAIEFTDEGAKKFAELTKRNINKPLAIFLDNQLISAPIVQQEIVGGSAVITGQFSVEEAKNLSIQLNAGALPVPIKVLEERRVGPTLGQESVNKSLVAGIIGLLAVVIYMGLYYGWWGLLADTSLLIYTFLVLAIFKTGGFILPPITLTLAGVAGFILSIGMAVDANILIFERMKEERRWGKSKQLAQELGFNRAWTSIWASNVSSLITAIILYAFGTSLVRGFAITLSIGVLISMFTAVVVTRTLLRLIIK